MTSNSSFAGDPQESLTGLAHLTVMEAFESGVLNLPDFYFTGDDYRYRLELEAKSRFLSVLRERFNAGVRYRLCVLKRNPDVFKWDTTVEQKAIELGRFLAGQICETGFQGTFTTISQTR